MLLRAFKILLKYIILPLIVIFAIFYIGTMPK